MVVSGLLHKTEDELPEQKTILIETPKGTRERKIDEPCLVYWDGKMKPSKYLTDEKRWEGHLEDQVPEYWIKLKELKVFDL